MRLRQIVASVAMLLVCAQAVAAQGQAPATGPMRWTIAAGVTMASGYPVGDTSAVLRRNAPGLEQSMPFLRAESNIERAIAFDARVAFGLSPQVSIEAAGTYSTPRLAVTISQDSEAVQVSSPTDRLSQYGVELSGLYHFSAIRMGSSARPYAIAGAGYLRQLHEGRLLVETGRTIHGGGGVELVFRGQTNPRARPFGVRVEGRLIHRAGGIDFEENGRTFPAFSALGFVRF